MSSLLPSLLLVTVTAAGSWSLGRALLRRGWEFPHPALRIAAEAAIGLLVVSHLIFAAVLAGWVGPGFLWGLAVALAVLAAARLPLLRRPWGRLDPAYGERKDRDGHQWEEHERERPGGLLAAVKPSGVIELVAASGFLAYGVWMVLLAQLPPIGFDALVYHLEVPRQMLEAGGHPLFSDNMYAYFPQLGEMLFLFGLGIVGDSAAKLSNALFGGVLLVAIFGFSRKHLERPWALLATGLFATIPSIVQTFSFAYVDLAFALYVFLAVAAVLQYVETRRLRWAVLAGVMAGGAWATKYTGMQVVFLLLLLLLAEHLWRRRRQKAAAAEAGGSGDGAGEASGDDVGNASGDDARGASGDAKNGPGKDPGTGDIPWAALVLPVVAFAVFAPYLLRTWSSTGWPLYPFHIAGFELDPAINWDAERAQLYMDFLGIYGHGTDVYRFTDRIIAPVAVFVTGRFWETEGYDGMVGPAFLLIPLLLWRVRKPFDVKMLALFAAAFMYYWASTTLQVRFLIPVLPVLCVLLAFGLQRRGWRWLTGLVMASMLVGLGFGVRETLTARPWDDTARPWSYWAGQESRQEFWRERILLYPIYEEANRRLGPDDLVYLVDMRHVGYLLDCRWTADFILQHWRLEEILESSDGPGEVESRLRERGFTHLMIDEALTLDPVDGLPPAERELLTRFLSTRATFLVRNPVWVSQSLWRIGVGAGDTGDPGASGGGGPGS